MIIRNDCLNELPKLKIDGVCDDINLGNDYGDVLNDINNKTDDINNKTDDILDRLTPKVITIEKPIYIKEYIEIRTTKYVHLKPNIPLPNDKIETINYGSIRPQNGWSESGRKGWWIKEGKWGRNYYKPSGAKDSEMISEEEFKKLFYVEFTQREIIMEGKDREKYWKNNNLIVNEYKNKKSSEPGKSTIKWVELSPGRWSPQ